MSESGWTAQEVGMILSAKTQIATARRCECNRPIDFDNPCKCLIAATFRVAREIMRRDAQEPR